MTITVPSPATLAFGVAAPLSVGCSRHSSFTLPQARDVPASSRYGIRRFAAFLCEFRDSNLAQSFWEGSPWVRCHSADSERRPAGVKSSRGANPGPAPRAWRTSNRPDVFQRKRSRALMLHGRTEEELEWTGTLCLNDVRVHARASATEAVRNPFVLS